jgi:N-methylhydantoinase A/oxoprolinase/acetone carboxylase beta subunit
MIDRLVAACERHLAQVGIAAPLMVVRGDGALISAAMVRERRSRPSCPAPPPASSARAG